MYSECTKHSGTKQPGNTQSTYPDEAYNQLARDLQEPHGLKCFRCTETHCYCDDEKECQSCCVPSEYCSYLPESGKEATGRDLGMPHIDCTVPLSILGLIEGVDIPASVGLATVPSGTVPSAIHKRTHASSSEVPLVRKRRMAIADSEDENFDPNPQVDSDPRSALSLIHQKK